MRRYLLIENGAVSNVIDSAEQPAAEFGAWVEAPDGVGPGWTYDEKTGQFSAPRPSDDVPPVVSMRQARLALYAAGKLAGVTAAIDAMTDVDQQTVARIEWEYAPMVERGSAFVALLGAAVGLDDVATDDLFRAAILL